MRGFIEVKDRYGRDVWINVSHVFEITPNPDHPGGSIIRVAVQDMTGLSDTQTPIHYYHNNPPEGIVRLIKSLSADEE